MCGSLFMICQQYAAVISCICHFVLRIYSWWAVPYVMMQYTLQQCVLLYNTYAQYGYSRKCQQKFWYKFHDERVPSRQTIHNLVNKLRTTGLLLDKKQKHKCQVLTQKLDDTGARLEYTPGKLLKCPAQDTGVSSPVQEQQHNCWTGFPVKGPKFGVLSSFTQVVSPAFEVLSLSSSLFHFHCIFFSRHNFCFSHKIVIFTEKCHEEHGINCPTIILEESDLP
jgi:hypothetical protein